MDVIRSPRQSAVVFFSFLALTACNPSSHTASDTVEKPSTECAATAVPNRFIVHWKDGTTTVEEAEDREALIRDVIEPNLGEIEYAEHDQVVKLSVPSVSQALAVDDTSWGQTKTEAAVAWNANIKGDGIIVAVIDSGAEVTHSQLVNQLAINTGETAGNGIDDDQNGYIDDVNGFDFYEYSGTMTDGTGHGTHVAGVILAQHEAGAVKGVAPKAKLLPLDFMNDYGEGNISDAIDAMKYAAKRGAKIINASWGGAPCSLALRKEIQELETAGVLFVSASGNGDEYGRGVNLDQTPSYPAAYGLSGQLTVGAVAKSNYMAGFSNYSYKLVGLLAPGVNIYSTYPGNTAVAMDGTSMATPFVAGAAALLMSHRPTASPAQVKAALLSSVDTGGYPVSSGGRLNVRKAIERLTALVP